MDSRDSRVEPTVPPGQEGTRRPKVILVGDVRWGLAWGFVLVLIGVVLLLDHMGFPLFEHIYRFWPLLIILFGAMSMTTQSARGFGFVMLLIGFILQLNTLGIISLSSRDFWPIVILSIGVLLIWGSLESGTYVRAKSKFDWKKTGAAQAFRKQVEEAYTYAQNDPESLQAVAVFSGCERRFSGQHFKGGKVVSVFGGVELDFRDADMDDEAILEISCVFGGVEIRVPETWAVHSRSLPVFGGFEDKSRRQKVIDTTGTAVNKPKTLVITGIVLFGGVEISN